MKKYDTVAFKAHISPEQEEKLERDKAAMQRERVRIALRMITHNESEERITLYTQLSSQEIKELKEAMLERQSTEQERKSEAMRQGMTFQDPPQGMQSPWQHL